jgi:phage tail-like protein
MREDECDQPASTGSFRVVIAGSELGFTAVGPLTSGTDAVNVVLRRALTRSAELYDWHRRGEPRDVTIQQLDETGGEVLNSWTLVGARPVRWTGPSFDAVGGGLASEELELAFDDLRWDERSVSDGSPT